MKILLLGAAGMVGDGVLRWLIASPKVSRIVAVSRKPLAVRNPKLETVIEPDMFHLQHVNARGPNFSVRSGTSPARTARRRFAACPWSGGTVSPNLAAGTGAPRSPALALRYLCLREEPGLGAADQRCRSGSNRRPAGRRVSNLHCPLSAYTLEIRHPRLSAYSSSSASWPSVVWSEVDMLVR